MTRSTVWGVLERIPGFNPIRADRHTPHAGRPDGHFTFKVGRKEHHVQFILLTHGYPKQVRSVIHELETTPRQGQTPSTYTVLVAPWFSLKRSSSPPRTGTARST